jgi:dTDP-4-amino-4,6-dideoxygalactose transaminase
MTTVLSPAVAFTVPPLAAGAESAVRRVLRSGWITTGPECGAFEAELSAYLGQPHVVAVASGTQALELSLRALRLDPGAAVLTPSLTFCGAVGAILHAGYRPVLVDVDEATLTPSPETVAAAAARAGRPAAIVGCDLGGYPVDHRALADAAGLPDRRVIVDAAHGPGGDVGRGAFFATCLSFYATKNLPIGEGGAVATPDADLATWLRSARLHGMTRDAWRRYLPGGSWRYEVAEIGYKANLTDLQAAIGRAQLVALPEWQARRAALVARYDAGLCEAGVAEIVRVPRRHPGHAWHLYQVLVPRRDEISAALADAGIGTSVHFIPVHRLHGYRRALAAGEPGAVPATDRVADRLLSLPLYPGLSDTAVDLVVERLARLLAPHPHTGGEPC